MRRPFEVSYLQSYGSHIVVEERENDGYLQVKGVGLPGVYAGKSHQPSPPISCVSPLLLIQVGAHFLCPEWAGCREHEKPWKMLVIHADSGPYLRDLAAVFDSAHAFPLHPCLQFIGDGKFQYLY